MHAGEVVRDCVSVSSAMIVFHTFVCSTTYAIGPSMVPTIRKEGELAIVDRYNYRILDKKFEVGDVVILVSPTDRKRMLCKRIRAVEGDIVLSKGRKFEIPEGYIWIQGDNPYNSTDSRDYGPIPSGLVLGKLIYTVRSEWPFLRPMPQTFEYVSLDAEREDTKVLPRKFRAAVISTLRSVAKVVQQQETEPRQGSRQTGSNEDGSDAPEQVDSTPPTIKTAHSSHSSSDTTQRSSPRPPESPGPKSSAPHQ